MLPDGVRPRFAVLAPSLAEQPQSSLCQMIDWLAASFGLASPEYFVVSGELDAGAFERRLHTFERGDEPVLLVGVTYAFVQFLDRAASQGRAVPAAVRLANRRHRGHQGAQSLDVAKRASARVLGTFGVPGYFVANEYGMTEMCSQFYDDAIRNHFGGHKRDRAKVSPPWVRTCVVSPVTLEPLARGERGLLRHFDLANVGSVSALQTEDVGVEVGDGFEILGRASGAEARGCALLLEQVA